VYAPFFHMSGTKERGRETMNWDELTLEHVRNAYRCHQPVSMGKHRIYSVLVPLVKKEDGLYLLYERRSTRMKTQPGESCFPGGHLEDGEDPLETALRETEEEIGIPRGRIELAGPGDILYGIANFTLYTYIGIIQEEDLQYLALEKDEVEEIFLIPLTAFFENPPEKHLEQAKPVIPEDFPYARVGIGKDYPWRVAKSPIYIYEIEGRVIWGMTAFITRNVLKTLAASVEGLNFDEEAQKQKESAQE
jgi:coenzyme A diphosphatase NUDT7